MNDSIDKIVRSYFASVTRMPFSYKKTLFEPGELKVSPLITRALTCPEKCGACCPKFSLDYLPTEKHPNSAIERVITLNGKPYMILSDTQSDNPTSHCRYLDKINGRCHIHPIRPFSCDFELIRFLHFKDGHSLVTNKFYGRGWNLTKVNGEKGAICQLSEENADSKYETVRKLVRLLEWCDYFEIPSKIDNILKEVL